MLLIELSKVGILKVSATVVLGPVDVLVILLVSIIAGFIGALFGLGGGVLIIPFLTLVEGVPVPLAVGASIVSVVATSSSSAAAYVQDHLTNLRLGMFLEIGTVAGGTTRTFVGFVLACPFILLPIWLILVFSSL